MAANLKRKLSKIVDAVAKIASSGSGEITQATYDEASQALEKDDVIKEATNALDLDCVAYFTNTLIALGFVKGMRERILQQQQNLSPKGLSQVAAFPLVDLWGRMTGIEALILQIAGELDAARTVGFSPALLKPRMATVYRLLESTLLTEVIELSKLEGLSLVSNSLDRILTMIRSEQSGKLGKVLEQHINSLPA